MEALLETAKSILAIAGTLLLIYTGVREFPFKLRDKKIDSDKVAFGLYTEAMNELAERDEGFSKLRDQLVKEIKRGDEQEDSIKQLRRTENANADEIRRLKLDLDQSYLRADELKVKWQGAEREIKIMRAILSRNGWLTPEIEAEIAASLEDSSAAAAQSKTGEPP